MPRELDAAMKARHARRLLLNYAKRAKLSEGQRARLRSIARLLPTLNDIAALMREE